MKQIYLMIALALCSAAQAGEIQLTCEGPNQQIFDVRPFAGEIFRQRTFKSQEHMEYGYDGIGHTGYVLRFTPQADHPQFGDWNESHFEGPQITFKDLSMKQAYFNNDMSGLPIGTFEVNCLEATIKE